MTSVTLQLSLNFRNQLYKVNTELVIVYYYPYYSCSECNDAFPASYKRSRVVETQELICISFCIFASVYPHINYVISITNCINCTFR